MALTGSDPRHVAQQLSRALSGRSDVQLAILFGSSARGRATPESDVDVAVLAPGGDRLELALELGKALGLEVDVVDLATAGIPLERQIVAHGIVVHEGSRGAAASWRARVLAALEVDGPWYGRMRDAWLERVAREGIERGRR
jgi:predicted nucleotidyltransferase